MTAIKYDVVVIGSGPGGYVAAIRCSQLGLKVAIIEKYSTLGGTCLNVGCIPSKALLDSSEHYHNATHGFEIHGINVKDVKVDFTKMIARKEQVVKDNVQGIAFLMKKNKIDVYTGTGSFVTKNNILVTKADNTQETIEADKVIIATGSKPSTLPSITVDKERIITSTEALSLKEIPQHIIVIGGGVIGLEMASIYARLGSKVSVVEFMESLIATMDADLGKEMKKVLEKIGIKFYLGHKVQEASRKGKSVTVKAESKTGEAIELKGDYVLVAVGRKAYTQGLGLDKIGITVDTRGKVPVDKNLETSVKGVYAIGDVVDGAMLAHKAEDEGCFVAEVIKGQHPHINYLLIPSVVYTWPEASAVGYTEQQLIENNIPYKKGSFPFKASGRARAANESDGFIKVLAHKDTDEILGVHMIGPRTADVIAEAVLAMEFRASAEDITRVSHSHPTYTEVFKEACFAAWQGKAIHM
jgi:dihydrolipoamide dehydrogenase